MSTRTRSRLSALRARIKRGWSEVGYANRRMFDIRTGEQFVERPSDPEPRARRPRKTAVPAH
jgi:hypothetical protein